MRKNQPDEIEICPEKIPVKNSQSGNQVQIEQNNIKQADSTLEVTVKNEQDEDTPINLVKGKRCNSPLPEVHCHEGHCHEGASLSQGILSHYSIMHANVSAPADNPGVVNLVQNPLTDSESLAGGQRVDNNKLLMPETIKQLNNEDEKKMKYVNLVEQLTPQLDHNEMGNHRISLNNSMTNVGGMLAKQLVSPLRSNYNTWYEEGNNRDDNFYSALPSSTKLPSFTLPPSSSLLPSSAAASSSLISYSRSHTTSKDSSPNHSPCSASTVDLGTATRVVISTAIRNASVALEEEEQSSPASNIVVISDPQARNIETAGTKDIFVTIKKFYSYSWGILLPLATQM